MIIIINQVLCNYVCLFVSEFREEKAKSNILFQFRIKICLLITIESGNLFFAFDQFREVIQIRM